MVHNTKQSSKNGLFNEPEQILISSVYETKIRYEVKNNHQRMR